ncbi:CRISPR-associated endonuclease Cas1 [Microcoleus sp. AT9_B5]
MDFSYWHLLAAWQQVRTRSNAAGIDGLTCELFAQAAEEQLHLLFRDLMHSRYFPKPAKGFHIPKKSGGHRSIGISTVRDRIVQRLLLQSLYPVLDEVFSDTCYAYRPGYSAGMAVAHLSEIYTAQPTWIVKADIEKFFDNLCWPLLLTDLERLQIAPIQVQLVEQQLKAGIVISGRYFNPGKGVVQGNILSGALANLYLTEFDLLCQTAGIYLIRYGDDFAVAAGGLLEATRVLNLIDGWLADIYLSLHPEKTRIIAPHEEFTFLGYQFNAGRVIAPVRKKPSFPQLPKQSTPPPSKAPRSCSIVKTHPPRPPLAKGGSSEHFWSESMTTLYVTDQGAYVKVHHQQFQVLYEGELRCSVPVNRVSHIVLFGCCNLSHGAVSLALQRRIPVMFLSHQGRYFGRLEAEGMAEVEYLAKQVLLSQNPEFVLRQAQSIVAAKLHNSRILLMRLNRRKHHRKEEVVKAIADLAELMTKVPATESVEVLFGYEGQGAHVYFQAFGSLLSEPFVFEKRTRRPPTDPVNSMMSLGYTLLHQNIFSLVQAVGLHPHFGNLHVPRKNHPALISDLIEEFRAPVVDSLVAYLVNSSILTLEDFTPPDGRGGVYLFPDALKKYLNRWNEKLQTKVTHPHTGYKVNYYRCLELQVWEYIACLTGEQEVYRPMKWDQ